MLLTLLRPHVTVVVFGIVILFSYILNLSIMTLREMFWTVWNSGAVLRNKSLKGVMRLKVETVIKLAEVLHGQRWWSATSCSAAVCKTLWVRRPDIADWGPRLFVIASLRHAPKNCFYVHRCTFVWPGFVIFFQFSGWGTFWNSLFSNNGVCQ